MQIYLDTFGAYLFVKNGMFAVRTKAGGEQAFALRTVEVVVLTKGSSASTDALALAAENRIPVIVADANTGHPLAVVQSAQPSGTGSLRKNQAIFARSTAGMAWVADCIALKIERQSALLQRLAENPAAPLGFAEELKKRAGLLRVLQKGFLHPPLPSLDQWDDAARSRLAGQFRGQEGTASRTYFELLGIFLRPRVAFAGRSHRPALDVFNTLLNYSYGMLYTHCHLALLKVGLDPLMGILHADQYAKPTLVYDFIEPFRPWADEVAVGLCVGETIGPDFFETEVPDADTGCRLARPGKSVVVEAMLSFLEARTLFDGKMVKRGVQIDLLAQKLGQRALNF